MKFKTNLIVIVLLTLFFLQCVLSMKEKSATFDEGNHLISGYTHLIMHDLRMTPEQPPLTKILAGLPLLFLNLKNPNEFESWNLTKEAKYIDAYKFSNEFLYHSGQDADKILFLGRLPSVFIALLLGYFVFLWTKQLYGLLCGYFALFLYAFSPNIIAHSQVVTPDIGLSCIILITLYYLRKFLKTKSYKTFLISSLCLGIALLTKFSALILLPLFLVIFYFYLPERLNKKPVWKFILLYFFLMLFIAFIIVWLGYGFEYGNILLKKESHPSAVQLLSKYLPSKHIDFLINLLEKIKIPFPSFFLGIAQIKLPLRDTFVWGKYYQGSPWFGYLFAFLIKTPIPSLIFIFVTLYYFLRKKTLSPKEEWFLLIPVIGFLFFSTIARFGLQLKYILPIYPFLFIFSSQIIKLPILNQFKYKLIFALLCLWYLIGTLNIYPHYLAYFNEFVGGAKNGYKYLVDSNLDWGQDLKLLKQYLEKNNIKEIYLAYFGTAEPDYYKINYKKLEPFKKVSGIIAISATYLQGVHTAKGGYDWLKKYEPVDNLGYSILIYNIK